MPAFQTKVIRFLTQSHWRISRRTLCSYSRLIQDSRFKDAKLADVYLYAWLFLGGKDLPLYTLKDRDARMEIWNKPPNETTVGEARALFDQ